MSEFKPGDEVRVNDNYPREFYGDLRGQVGTVVNVGPDPGHVRAAVGGLTELFFTDELDKMEAVA